MSFTWKRPEGRLMSPEDMMRVIIRVADELGMPDKRGACIIAGMTVRQESDFWRPGNNADPAFAANPAAFPHDSMGNDGRSVGPYQQQTSGPPPASQWGWGGLYGDPEGTRKRMDPYESTKLFLAALKKRPYRATNAVEAGDWAQDVQQSGVPDAYDKHWQFVNDLYNRVAGTPTPPPPPVREPYGVPRGSNSGGYGNNGFRFPDWVYALGNAFGLLPSTYDGHQESDRSNEGYVPNPQRLNRGIDWARPNAPDEVDRMQRFAEYMFSIRDQLDQLIWENPRTGQRLGVAAGKDVSHTPYYDYDGGYNAHRNHVHTRQGFSLPLPGGAVPLPIPNPQPQRPAFQELDMFNGRNNSTARTRPPMNFFLHTEEGNGSAKSLAEFCQGQNGVSYHYTLRDRIVYDVVDTDYYSWSVLQANVFSINLCFAGSRAAFTREQWLAREGDIEIAAYLAVQDCRKYGMSVEVLVPRHDQRGSEVYAGSPRSGISDHNYVTRELGIGDHTDVGPNFPWDVFVRYVNKYANTAVTPGVGDDMSAEDVARLERKIDILVREQTQRHPSRSQVREPGEGLVDTWAGMDLNDDGNVDLMATFLRTLLKYPPAKARLQRVAAGVEPGRNQDDPLIAQQMLVTADRILRLIEGGPATVTAGTAAPAAVLAPSAQEVANAVAAILPPNPDPGVAEVLRAENAALRAEIRRLNEQAATPSATVEVAVVSDESIGDISAEVIDSVTKYVNKATQMKPQELEALDRAHDVLKLNGAKK